MTVQTITETPTLSFEQFADLYRALTGHSGAWRWQYRLFTDIASGRFPSDIELATGLGKTSIIALWILALGRALLRKSTCVPRRLAYVVDRRVVVDQASEFAEQLRERLELAAKDENHALYQISIALKNAGFTASLVEVSTLRGQRALDTRWRDDPTRPAIVVGTVDMIGSRLLFSAYGRVGPWGLALEAGLIGQDCLVVLDEAHLCSPFATTLTSIERRVGTLAPFAVVRMGATMEPVRDLLRRTPGLPEEPSTRRVFQLLDNDIVLDGHTWPKETDEPTVSDRLNARKKIEVEAVDIDNGVGAQLAGWAIEKAKADNGVVIGIVLNTVSEVRKCRDFLSNRGIPNEQIVILTGSMRGQDRDDVVESEGYARVKSQRDRKVVFESPIFLVATSCVEVGADIDCDHLGIESCTADSLIQRLGRVNRLGLSTREVSVTLVGDKDGTDPASEVFKRVQTLLSDGQELQASPATFPERLRDGLDDATWRKFFDVRIPPPALTNAALDDFAMTSKYPDTGARPDVGRWLHGSVEDSALYTELAWREELDRAAPDEAKQLVAAFPISARETARCPLYEAIDLLKAIQRRAVDDKKALGRLVLLVTRGGETTPIRLSEIPTDDDKLRSALRGATVVLPTGAGGYSELFVNRTSMQAVSDIAERVQPTSRAQRRRLWIDSGRVSASGNNGVLQIIASDTDAEDLLREVEHVVKDLLGTGWRIVEAAGTGMRGIVVARKVRHAIEEAEDDDSSLGFQKDTLLSSHLDNARSTATELCKRLSLPANLRDTIIEAAGQHDLGKARPWWQRAVGQMEKPAIAKSHHLRFDHKINRGYRHEFGSVADLVDEKVMLPNSIDRELCLHLVAAHHGHARPGFRGEAAGPIVTDAEKRVLIETPIRFSMLQNRYGWWALAWLEALVKAADVLASRDVEDLQP